VWYLPAMVAVRPTTIVVREAKLARNAVQDNGQVICVQVGLVPIGTIHAQQEVFPSQCAQVGPLLHES
jgi:hypothetical protein